MTRIRTAAAALVATALALVISQQAFASGFAIREDSAAGLGMAFAGGGSSAATPATIFNNPAGMTHLDGIQVETDVSVIMPSAQFTGSAKESGCAFCGPLSFPISGSGSINEGETAVVPAGYGLYSITPDIKLGIAVTAPFGLKTEYSNTWVGRYFGITSSVESVDINPNIAYRVNDWLSVGGGVSAQYFGADFTNAIDQNALAGLPPGGLQTIPGACSNANCDAFVRVAAHNWGVGFNGGILLDPLPGTSFGVSFRSEVHHTLNGDANFSGVSPVLTMASPLLAVALSNSAVQAAIATPANVDFSLTQKVTDQLTLSADLQWTGWSSFQTLGIVRTSGLATGTPLSVTPENFRNTIFAAVGGSYAWDDRWTLRAGVAFDQTPVRPTQITVRLPDGDRYWIAAGVGYKVTDSFTVDASYAHIFIPNVSLNSSVNSVILAATPGGGTDTLTGSYSSNVNLVSVSARLRF